MHGEYPRFPILMICCHCVTEDKTAEQNIYNTEIDDRFDFDPEECNVVNGKWVFNSSIKPLYSDRTCPYLDMQVSCVKNGRPDSDYRHWEWQPEDCTLPRLKDLADFILSVICEAFLFINKFCNIYYIHLVNRCVQIQSRACP